MKTRQDRLLLCTKDMMRVTGKSESTVWRIGKAIRQKNNKLPFTPITLHEFCEHFSFNEEQVLKILGD